MADVMFAIVNVLDNRILMVVDDAPTATEIAATLQHRAIEVEVRPMSQLVGTTEPRSGCERPAGYATGRPPVFRDRLDAARSIFAVIDASWRTTRGQVLLIVDDFETATDIAAELNSGTATPVT